MDTEIVNKLRKVLSNTIMTTYEINKCIVSKSPSDNNYQIEINVHGYTVDQVQEILEKLLSLQSVYIDSIKLIHGYKHGSIIKDFLNLEFTHERLRSILPDTKNQGITYLLIHPLNPANIGHRVKSKVKSKGKSKTEFEKKKKQSIKKADEVSQDLTDHEDFLLTMIKERVSLTRNGSALFDSSYLDELDDTESDYCKELTELRLSVNVFLNQVIGFYKRNERYSIKLKVKSIDQLMKSMLLDNVCTYWTKRDYVVILQVKKQQKKKVSQYIEVNWPDIKPRIKIF